MNPEASFCLNKQGQLFDAINGFLSFFLLRINFSVVFIVNIRYRSSFDFREEEDELDQTTSNDILTMRTNTNELNIHLLLSNDIDRLRELGKY